MGKTYEERGHFSEVFLGIVYGEDFYITFYISVAVDCVVLVRQ